MKSSTSTHQPEQGGAATGAARANGQGPAVPRRPFGVLDILFFPTRLIQRILFPRLLDRYIQGELFGPLVFGWTLFIVLFVCSFSLFKLAQLAARGARLSAIAEVFWLRVVESSVYCLPMAVLLAGLMAFGRLSGDSELIATQACGVPNLRGIWNAFLLGLVLSFAGLAMNEYVIPPAGKRLHLVEDQIKAELRGQVLEEISEQKSFVLQENEDGKLARLVVARNFEPEEPPHPATLREVTYVQYEKGEWSTIVQSARAEWIKNAQWRFYHPEVQFRSQAMRGKQLRVNSEILDVKFNKSPEQVRREQKDADQMSYRELDAYIRTLKAQGGVRNRIIREFEVEKERKLAIPFAALVLAMIGAPLGIRRQRSTAGVGIGLSLLIIIIYYFGMGFLGVLGQSGQLSPVVAAWGCNGVGLLAGFFLTWRSSG
jgi:lipopolysaccharide export system permease protein